MAQQTDKKILLLLMLICFAMGNANQDSPKHVIGAWKYGFFADFFGVLNHLLWCRNTGHTPVVYWGKESLYYQPGGYNGSENVWGYYFEPVSEFACAENEPRDYSYSPEGRGIHGATFFVEHYDMITRKLAKNIIQYFGQF